MSQPGCVSWAGLGLTGADTHGHTQLEHYLQGIHFNSVIMKWRNTEHLIIGLL